MWKPHNMIKQRLGSTGHWSWLMLDEGMLGVFKWDSVPLKPNGVGSLLISCLLVL